MSVEGYDGEAACSETQPSLLSYTLRYVSFAVVYYESLKRTLKTKSIYGYRYDERLKTNVEECTHLVYTQLSVELEHLKIETRLTSETPVSEMGEYTRVM